MAVTEGQFACTFPAIPASVTAARHAVLGFAQRADAPPLACENVALAVSEAVTNVVVHGYPDGVETCEVQVRAALSGDRMDVSVADDGRGMWVGSEHPGLGMGLALMQRVSDHFEIRERESGGVELRMSFALDHHRAETSPGA